MVRCDPFRGDPRSYTGAVGEPATLTGEELAETPAPTPPRRRRPSMWPAMIVVGLAVVILVGFGVLSAVSGTRTVNTPTTTPGGPARAAGGRPVAVPNTTLRGVPAATAMRAIETVTTPPANVVAALWVPKGVSKGAVVQSTSVSSSYDRTIRFTLDAPEATVVAFYRTELARHGWKLASVGTPPHAPNGTVGVLSEIAGDDGWYWEAGVEVSPTRFTAGKPNGTTTFTVELYEVPDDD